MGNIKQANPPQPIAIFLDCDGVLNNPIMVGNKPEAPTNLQEFVIPAEVKPVLEKLKQANYLLIAVTNKPDVAEGRMTQAEVDKIFAKMRHELPLDDIFICYSRNAFCFKPKPGLLLTAAKQYNINLEKSYMIGDRWVDISAGQSANCLTIWIDRGYPDEIIPNPPANHTAHSLLEAVQWILGEKK